MRIVILVLGLLGFTLGVLGAFVLSVGSTDGEVIVGAVCRDLMIAGSVLTAGALVAGRRAEPPAPVSTWQQQQTGPPYRR